MSASTTAEPSGAPRALETLRIWGLHLLCFVLPLTCLAFFLTAPHAWWASPIWIAVVVASVMADFRSSDEKRQPAPWIPGWPFDGVLYVLVGVQVVNVLLGVRMVALHGFWTVDTLVAWLLLGITSGYSGIVVAHELIHRSEQRYKLLGRLLLTLVLYEHFFTEHIRGHHVKVATPEDPATAGFGTTWREHRRRTVPAQFRSAWRLETKRLGDVDMKPWDPRNMRNRVLQGLVVEWGFAFGVLGVLGPGAFVFHLAQAHVAVTLLEIVNYFEHWGLVRQESMVQPTESWDTNSWFTLYTLIGLSRHADHHAYANRPYQQLRYFEESPKLPAGYFGSVVLTLFDDRKFRRLLTHELRRRKLGPFTDPAFEAPPAAA